MPPRKRPTNCDAKRSSTADSSPPVISSAVRMKNGTASSANRSIPENRYFGSATSGTLPDHIAISVAPPSAKATGTPTASSPMQPVKRTVTTCRSELRRVGVELPVAKHLRPYDETVRHQRQVQQHQCKAGRHRQIDGANRYFKHRRRLRPRHCGV